MQRNDWSPEILITSLSRLIVFKTFLMKKAQTLPSMFYQQTRDTAANSLALVRLTLDPTVESAPESNTGRVLWPKN